MRARRTWLAVCILAGGTAALFALPWTHQMINGPVVRPQMLMLAPPDNTLAVGRTRVLPPFEAAERLANPRDAAPDVLQEGAALFGIYCAVCHGPDAHGDGPLASRFPRMPDLTLENVRSFEDGYIYSVIGRGGVRMPGYAESLSRLERWAIVHHLRALPAREELPSP
jgi:mono/diheme cytochrome c family protein